VLTLRIVTAVAGFSASSALGSKAIASGVARTIAGTVAGKAAVGVSRRCCRGISGGGVFGAAGGTLGAYVGVKVPALNAQTMTERRLLEKAGRVTMAITVVHICLIASWSLAMVYRVGPTFVLSGERQAEKYRRMGPMSRPLIRSGQWSQTTTGISQPAARLNTVWECYRSRFLRSFWLQFPNATQG